MSTILDALKKVERERESPGDRLRHEPEPSPPRSRRVSTVTIIVCALLGFGAGAGIALWRNAAPTAAQGQQPIAVPAVPHISVPSSSTETATEAAPSRIAQQPETDEDSALEPSPFAPPRVAGDGLAGASVPAAVSPTDTIPDARAGIGDTAPDPERVAALVSPGGGNTDTAPQPAAEILDLSGAPIPEAQAETNETFDDVLPADDTASAPTTPPTSDVTIIDTGRSPPGAPLLTLSFLNWSSDPTRRFAFISVDRGPSQRVREGDVAGEATVETISPDGVRFRQGDTLFIIRPRH